MSEVIGEMKTAVDWFNAITCGTIIGWWMRALYDWMRARSVRSTVRAFVVEKYDEAPVPTPVTPVPEPAPENAEAPNQEASNRDRAGND